MPPSGDSSFCRLAALSLVAAAWLAPVVAGAFDMPPSLYPAAHAAAPEALIITVTNVTTQLAGVAGGPGSGMVFAEANVVEVKRTATKLKAGSSIKLIYPHIVPVPGGGNFPPAPIVTQGSTYLAYLAGGPPPYTYSAAVGGESFLDPATPLVTPASLIQSHSVNLGTLPTPEAPEPEGTPKPLIGVALDAFAKVARKDDKWTVTLGRPEPVLPLMVNSPNPPPLLGLYWPDRNGPANQPAILVYRAGSVPNPNSPGNSLSVERALIVTGSSLKVIGDVLWAVRPEPGDSPVPQPRWSWNNGNLTVENPYEKSTQQLPVIPKSGSAPTKQ